MATDSELMAWYWEAPQIRTSTTVPGNLFLPGGKVAMRVEVSPPPNAATLRVSGRLFDSWDHPAGEVAPVELNERNAYSASLDLASGPGYYRVQLSVANEGHRADHETRYAVVPDNASAAADPDSPFGVNTHFNQGWPATLGPIVRRAGIAWIRDGEAPISNNPAHCIRARRGVFSLAPSSPADPDRSPAHFSRWSGRRVLVCRGPGPGSWATWLGHGQAAYRHDIAEATP